MKPRPQNRRPRRRIHRKTQPDPAPTIPAEGLRLNRYIAQAGICARRKADELIAEGQVKINGTVVTALGSKVQPGDQVHVGKRLISPTPYLYLLLNKPRDVITTADDDRGRTTVLDLIDLSAEKPVRIFPVGRLDRHTVGALLLTNDGDLAQRLMHPRYVVEKMYHVRTKAPIKPDELAKLKTGILLEDGPARADQVAYLDPQNRQEIGMALHEGRNRQIRRMLEALGHTVAALERVTYAGLTLKGIRRGKWRRLTNPEIHRLRKLVRLA